ncbi:MAG: SocA family protein [Planctomycetes bacterium]|nr:SocA family protein [Planctomycetota bacterium]
MGPYFDAQKATQAAAVVMRRLGKRISRLRLVKLLYIADRTAMKERGHPIVGGAVVAMTNGPVHSQVYDLIKGAHPDEPLWSRHVTTEGPRDLLLTEEPGVDRLSEYEINILNEATDRHNELDDFDLAEATHSFGEWAQHWNPDTPDTSTPIPLESIVRAVCAPDECEEIIQELKDRGTLDGIFSRAAAGN